MKNLFLLFVSLGWGLFSVNAWAHGPQGYRQDNFISFSDGYYSPSHSYLQHPSRHTTPYSAYSTSNSLIAGISYRNNNSRSALQQRVYRSPVVSTRLHRNNAQLTYRNAYRSGFRDGHSSANNGRPAIRSENGRRAECYEIRYDRHGNRIRRTLPAAACRH
tara:strand:+ start:34107 stop:34589 length:483 start_codon:yes stop_codon:yes gene_type:complete